MAQEFTGNRKDFLTLLEHNPGIMIFKFTAVWCKPCQLIKEFVTQHIESITANTHDVVCYEIDVDECFDVFAYMKTKKMMKGIPTLMAYKQGTTSFVPDDSISGIDKQDVSDFFTRCRQLHK